MLIYAKKSDAKTALNPDASASTVSLASKPPARAMSIIQILNTEHENACKDFKEK